MNRDNLPECDAKGNKIRPVVQVHRTIPALDPMMQHSSGQNHQMHDNSLGVGGVG